MYKLLRRAAEWVGVALFASLFLVFVIQIAARYLLDRPLPWTDEAASILYIWSILWSAALICRDQDHVAFDLIYQGRSARTQRYMAVASTLLIGSLCAWALPGVLDYIAFMRRESSAVLAWPMHWVFAPFGLLLLTLVIRNLLRLWRLLGSRWQQALGSEA